MKGAVIVALIALMPQMALALSCLPYNVQDAFVAAQKSQARFVVVHGQLEFDASQLPVRDMTQQQPEDIVLDARLRGKSLSLSGFEHRYDKPVTVMLSCTGPWCAHAEAGSNVLAFVELGPDGGIIASHPCGGNLFARPTPQVLRAVTRCFQGKSCAVSR